GMLAYFIFIMFSVNSPGSAFIWWIFIAIIISANAEPVVGSISLPKIAKSLMNTAVVIIGLVLMGMSLRPFWAGRDFQQGLNLLKTGRGVAADPYFKSALKLNPYEDLFYWDLGQAYLRIDKNRGDKINWALAITYFKKGKAMNPYQVDNYAFLGDAYIYAARRYNPRYYNDAVKNFNKAIKLRPYSAQMYYLLGLSYQGLGNRQQMNYALRRAKELGFKFPKGSNGLVK
ncbi:MAG TPA: tetratricopeptide repeat protein, partial [Actinobacteria bacterium]|nr:tetratricopeptide repeat protein [Actinomycetes bacterium]HEX21408.1 tetratricopeptide repeat protein [Actinomycetota bacterium]